MDSPRHTCLKLEVPNTSEPEQTESIFVKGTWFASRFHLSITNGLDAWICNGSEDDVGERSYQWDQPVSEYIELAERYLGFQQPGSVYGFFDAGNGDRREEVVSKAQSCEKLKVEAEKCLAQSERFSNEKFLGVLNSKKTKLRELRDKLSKQESSRKLPEEEEEESTDKTEIYGSDDEKSEEEPAKNLIGTSKNVSASRPRGRKRK
ncbi:unnamed protein product [Ilex paraguariensis]|uniref:XRCC4 N-terminal domain-containing protein n=1 Tax=Ilex paraguariensis TaxID=185542 RepID=A0ABC8SZS9_9AQUA